MREIEVATGGQPEQALLTAITKLAEKGHIGSVGVAHDDDCPCTAGSGESMRSCTCEIVVVTYERVA